MTSPVTPEGRMRIAKMIHGALMAGVALFLLVTGWVHRVTPPAPVLVSGPLLTYVGLGILATMLLAVRLLPGPDPGPAPGQSPDQWWVTSQARLIVRRLVPLAALVTPNSDEAAVLVGASVRTPDDMERAGRALVELGARAALVKGGHLAGEEVVDVLIADGMARRFTRPRLETTSTHGTGCTLSAAIAAGLALGRPLERAVADALDFVHRAIAAAPGLGRGHGPLNHFVPAPPRPPADGL